jgi:hypothetical protein
MNTDCPKEFSLRIGDEQMINSCGVHEVGHFTREPLRINGTRVF